MYENNNVIVSGTVIIPPEYSHTCFNIKFDRMQISVKRLSNKEDLIPVIIPEHIISNVVPGQTLKIKGEFRSYDKYIDNRNRKHELFVFAKEVEYIKESENENQISMEGFICKVPNYRETPLGRTITDLLLAVHRHSGQSDYIPCITWGINALYAADLPVGTHVRLQGRIQSREYIKKISESECIKEIAYEVSINTLEVCDENN